MNSIGSAHADPVPISPKILAVGTPDRMLIIIAGYLCLKRLPPDARRVRER